MTRLIVLTFVCVATLSQPLEAGFITTNTIAGPTTIDFSTQATLINGSGPIQIGGLIGEDVSVTGNPNSGISMNSDAWGLGTNGTWGDGRTYVSIEKFDMVPMLTELIFAFNDGPVSAVGGFMNHAPDLGADLIITAKDSSMNTLETYNVTTLAPIVTMGWNGGAFRGIDRGSNNDISYFVVSGIAPAVDDLSFARNGTVPEPTSLTLWSLGLVGMTFVRLRARRSQSPSNLA